MAFHSYPGSLDALYMLNLFMGIVLPKRKGTLQVYLPVLGTFKEGPDVVQHIWKVTCDGRDRKETHNRSQCQSVVTAFSLEAHQIDGLRATSARIWQDNR